MTYEGVTRWPVTRCPVWKGSPVGVRSAATSTLPNQEITPLPEFARRILDSASREARLDGDGRDARIAGVAPCIHVRRQRPRDELRDRRQPAVAAECERPAQPLAHAAETSAALSA